MKEKKIVSYIVRNQAGQIEEVIEGTQPRKFLDKLRGQGFIVKKALLPRSEILALNA